MNSQTFSCVFRCINLYWAILVFLVLFSLTQFLQFTARIPTFYSQNLSNDRVRCFSHQISAFKINR